MQTSLQTCMSKVIWQRVNTKYLLCGGPAYSKDKMAFKFCDTGNKEEVLSRNFVLALLFNSCYNEK